ncbi:MAG: hypothetical protein GX989_03610 [Firmicutes bacterium]|nr:hypothetical protein [Bacillota bacterium]
MEQYVRQLRMLWQLQELEQQMQVQENDLQGIPSVKEHHQKQNELLAFQKMLQENKKKLAMAKKEQRRKELELQTMIDLLERLQHKLYSGEIIQVRELENLEKKVQSTRKDKSSLEDDILQYMEIIEQGENDYSDDRKIQAEKEDVLQQLEIKAQKDVQVAQRKLDLSRKQWEELRQNIDADLLDKYAELSRHLRGRCISLVQKGFCGICNVSLPSSFRARMLTPGQFVFCENCGCLLVPGD